MAALAMAMLFSPVQAQEGSAPDKPTGLTVASVSHDSVELDWDDSSDSSITHYQVFRRDRAVHDAGEFVIIEEDTGSTATEYTDATVEADEEYVYRVKAVNAHGASPWSDHVRADTPTGPGQEAVYTYEDGDRTIRVILQGDLVIQETGADTPSDDVVRRTAGGNIVRKPSGQGGADLPVFRSASGGALMTLPGGVLLALDPEWDRAAVNGFFARNNISKGRISELDYIPNGFFVRTEPGFPSLELANALAAQKGVLLSSPNWWREVRQDPGEPKGDDRRAAQETGDIEDGFMNASDLPLGTTYNDSIDPPENYDFFKLDLSSQSGTTDVRIYTTGEFDTSGLLFDIDKYLIERGNDSIGTRNFSLLASLQPGVYYVVVFGAPYAYNNNSTDTGNYTLHAETITATRVSLGSSVTASIGAAGEFDYFKLDLSGQTGDTDVSLFTVSDDLLPFVEGPSGSLDALRTVDTLGDRKWVTHWSDDASLSPGVYLFMVGSLYGDTGDYSLRAAAMPDHGSSTATATTLSLDAPTSGKITSASDADYFKLVLTEAKNLVILAFAHVNAVMLDSGGTEIPVNKEIRTGGFNSIIDDFASGTYYVKITAPDASSSDPDYYALYAYEDTGYGTWVDGCADDTDDLDSSTINDPLYACQWHLNSGDSAGMDINVESVWAEDITGAGVNVAVVDYTIDYSHDDLSPNINTALNHDYGGRGNTYRPAEHHGTWVAGVLAARDNTIGVRGVAPRATIYGHNILADGYVYVTDVNEADAMARNRVATAVSNNSWGPVDGYAFDHAPAMWEIAIDSGVTQGYDGKGVFYAWAGGNGHRVEDSSNFDEYANYYGVTAVCAVDDDGIRSAYSEQGDNLWVCAPSHDDDRGIVTTENSDRYTNTFGGTSSATPKVSGVAALLRHANPDLTWRDLKLILAASARQNDASNAGWEEGARKYGSTDDSDRYHFNHEYGFGVVDAAAAVALARDWRNLPEFKNASSASGTLNRTIPDNTASGITSSLSLDTEIDFTEFVEVNVTIDHTLWRDLRIELVSPAGTVSTLATPVDPIRIPFRPPHSTVSPGTFRFGSAKHLGEDPDGAWTLRVADELASDQGTLTSWSIKVYGHRDPAPDLVVEAPTVSHSNPVAGTPFTLRATVRNQGGAAAGSTTLRYYRSTNDTISTSDTAVGTKTVSGLAAAGTSAESIDLTAPTSAGTYYYGACVDAVTNESDRTNNCSTTVRVTVIGRPDLVMVTPAVIPSNPLTGASFTFWTTVRNRGSGEAGSTTLRYYRSTNATIDTNDTAVGTNPVYSLSAGLVSPESIRLFAPDAEGTYYYYACVDAVSGESDTANNCSATVTVTVTAPDLVVDPPTVSDSSPLAGSFFTLSTTVRNQGSAATVVAPDLRYYRSTDDTIDTSDTLEGFDPVIGLGAGFWSPESIRLFAPDAPGTYYYGACVSTVANESDTTNNCSTAVRVTVGAAPAPDLVVEAPTVSHSNPVAGTPFTLRATVRNQGGAAAGSATLRYYRSNNATISSSDTPAGTDSVSSLSAGASSAQSIRLTAPATTGTYYYGACVGTVSGESVTTNNCSAAVTVTVTVPDLVVDTPTVSDSSPLTGASFTLRATVRNQGSAAAGNTTLRYYRSTNATIDTNDSSVGTDAVSGLAAAATGAESIDLTAPSTAGTYYYGACVGTVTNESDTTNNCSVAVRVTVVAPPDLVVGTPRVSDSNPAAGTALTLSATVHNQGGSTAAGTILTYYRSTNATIDTNDTSVGTDRVSGLDAGTSSAQSIPLTAPSTPGTYYYGACVGTVTNESDTTNNCSVAVAVTVGTAPAPDLVVEAPSVSDSSPLTGASFTLRATVRNLGSAAAGSSTLRYYRSSDATISTSDTPETSTAAVGVLDAGASITQLTTLTAPATAGTYYYGACVDALTNESDTANNCSAAVGVTVGAAPVFNEGDSTERRVAENRAAGTNVGSAVTATDADNDTLTYSLEGTDAASFSIVSTRGQIRTVAALNHEARSRYSVMVRANDGKGGTDTIAVTISVTDVNEPPTVHGEDHLTIFENDDLIASYSASDPEGVASTFTWSVTGTDRGDFVIDEQGYLRFRNTPDFERPADSNRDNVYVFTVRATDEGGLIGSLEVTATVSDFDERPTITTTSNSATALRQNENVTSRLYTYRATDPEGADTVTWSVRGVDKDFFTIDERGQFSFKEENAPDYERPADSGRDNVYNVEIQAEDSGGIEASLPVTVTVRDVNEGPEVTSGSPSFTISENRDLPNAVYEGFDPEGGTVTRWTVGGTDGGDFSISQEGVLTFRNTPDFERPVDSNRDNIYQLQVRPYDGRYYGSFDVTVTVTDVNEPPTITTTSSSATALRQNENVTSRLYTYRATDPEGADTVTWSVEGVDARFFDIDEKGQFSFKEENAPDFEQPADSGRDRVYNVEIQATDDADNADKLDVTVTVANDAEGVEPTITTRRPPATYRENDTRTVYTFRASDPQRGAIITWSLSGADSDDFTIDRDSSGRGVLAFISPPDYENAADSDGQNDYDLTVIATDEDDNVDRLSFTITVIAVDEGPEVSGPSSFEIDENGSLPNAVYTATDPEGSNVARWSVGGRDGGDFFITQGGTLYFRSPPDYESPADSDRDNVYEVTIQPSDGRNNGSYPVTVTVTDVDEPPEFRKGSKESFSYRENGAAALYTYRATDPEGAEVTWSVSGVDARAFTIDRDTGVLTFRNPPDHDAPVDDGRDNEYQVAVVATDQASNPASLPVTVTVTEVNEGPVISLQGNAPGSVPENTPVTQVLATYTATDPERPGVQITQWSTTGRDGGDFVINALGQLMFRNPPDYERPADSNRDNVYEVEIRASDGRNTGTLEEVQRVTVTDVNEAPIITTTSRTAFTQPEDRTSTLYTFRATDPEGDDVSWGLSGTDSSAFTMSETGALSFTNPPDYEQPADSGGDNVYNVTVQASDGRNTGTLDVTVTVTDHNEGQEPTISTRRPPSTYRENGTSAVYTFRATDPQRDTITWKLEGTDREDFTLAPDSSGRAVLAFRNSPDFESPADADRDNVYELTVVATDPDDNSDRVDFTITVTDHNEGVEPTISTRRPPATYRENDTRTVYTFRASDPQRGTTITWRLDGTDAEDFTLTADDSGRGVLTFNNPPDFENPIDADENNVYELAVVATDDDGNSDRVDFTIAVTDVNEGPVITLEGTETTTVSENTPDTKVLADFTARDPEDTTANIFRWSTAGRDGGDFVISDLGELRFRSSPDYERPADSDRNNVYEVTVRAYDGRVYGAHDVTVTVTPVNEAPVITTKNRTEFTLRENFTAVLYTYRATDQDEDDAVTWSVEGDDGGDFAIYNGILNFRLLPDLENPADEDEDNVYEITVVAEDRAGLRDTVDAVVTITDQSEGPVIAGTRAYTVEENYDIARVLGSYTATDAKDNRLVFPRWSLSGRDGGDFTINEDGELAFRNIPDYDRPADSNRDNVYEVTVRGHDSQAYGNLEVTVTVTPVNEHAPVVTGRETLSFRENTAVETRLHTYRATDGDRDTSFTWSLEGDDSDAFVIDQGGVLTFSAPPDYEDPADRGTDNVYQVTVVASDGAKRGTLDVTVTVTEQNEGPVVSGTPEFTVVENRHLPSSAVYTARDPEAVGGVATTIRWSVSGRDGGDFTIHRDTGVLAFRTPPDHERPADADRDNVYEVTVRAHDGRNYGDFQVTVTVEDVAEITGPAAITRTENFEGVLATYLHAGQGDLNVDPSWRLTGADSGDFTIDRETGELTFRSIPDHERPADSNRDNVYNFTVQVSDGSYHGTLDVTVTVDAVNEPPAVTGRDSLSFRENTPVTTRLHTYRATDPEGDGFTWHLGGPDAEDFTITTDSSGRGVLTFASPPNFDIPSGSGAHVNEYLVTVVASDGTNRGTLDVTVTVTDQNEGAVVTGDQTIAVRENQDPAVTLHTYLASDPEGQRITRWSLSGSDGGDFLISANGELTFRNTPDYDRPADSNRDNEYLVTVRAYDGRTYGNLDVTVTVSNVNEHDPVIRSGSRTSFTYREEGTAALYTYRATDGDKDDTITWTTEGPDRGDFTIDGDTGELTFREPPDYEDPQDSGANSEYNLTVVATDSGRLTDRLDVTVTVTAVDEGPEVSGVTTYTVPEGQELARATFSAEDPEDLNAAVTSWRLAGSDAGDFTITDTGGNSARLTFRNTPDYDRPADSNRDNEYLVTIRAYNGSTYGSLDVTVKVTDENEAEPVVTGRDTLSFRENTATTTRLHTYRATDTDRNTEIIWSVEGDDGDYFAIEEGVLTFSAPPDYEGPTDSDGDNVYQVRVVASDGSNEGTLAVTVTVTDVNEGPVIAVTSANTAITVKENHDEVLATYAATDPEDPAAAITRWSVTGRDGGDFSINQDGELTFRNPPDHERPADSGRDNVYEVTVRASDGRVYGAHDVTVTVEAVDEAPEFRSGSRDSFSYRENGTAALYTYRATDPEGDKEVTWSVTGRDGGQFTIDQDTGVLSFLNPPDYDDPTDDGRDNEYLVTVVATDQTGRATNLPVTVTVTDVNEGPVIAVTNTNTAITVDENHDQVLAIYTATDPEDPDLEITRWSVTGRDGGDFTINDGGELTFRNPPDHERPADSDRDSVYEVTVRASDGRYYGTLNVTVTVRAVDEAPEFQRNTQDSFVYPENGTSAIYTYRATDPEGSDVTWGLSGTDSGAFSIGKTGVLTFKLSPDYEDPADRNDDNVYQVVVQASDDSSPRNTNPMDVTVTVTNLTDARAVIRGTAQVGRTLTAETSGIPDKDRSDRVDFSYQWLADETDVEGATDPTYEITEKDEGKTIKVRVTFTDNAGREETLTSAATAPVKPAQSNEPATGLPAINGTAQVGETLTADTSGVADADGLSNVQYEYQWLADDSDIAGATNATYTLTDSEESKAITVQVRFTDDADNEETLTSTATDAVAAAVQTNSPANGAPTISGTAQVGETLTANTSGIADADGLSNVQYEYQWLADDSDIAGATNATYTLTDSEESKAIAVQVGFSDDRGNDEALTSAATGAVAARPAQLTATFPASPFQSSRHKGDDDRPQVIVAFNLPVQSFDKTTPSVSLTGATVSSLVRHEEDGLENAWVFFLDPEGNDDVVFTLVAGQSCDMGGICTGEGKMLSEGETTTLPGPDEEDKPDNTDSNEPNSPATGLPTINGTAQVGETLTADTSGITDADGLSNVPYEYQWLADDSDISGATNATYTLAAEDEGKAITVRVSFTDDADNEETLTSAATAAVAAKPNSPPTGAPTITGTVQVGETLTANTTGIADADGLSSVQYEYQWLADDSDISGATNATYTLADADEGKAVSLQVSFTDDADNEETLTSAATGAVAGAQPTEPPTKPSGLSATASHDSVTLTWDDPGDDTITGYVILRRIPGVDPEGQFDELVADTGTAATTYTDGTVSAEARYTYRIKAINEHGVSERSRWVHIDTPAAPAPEAEQAAEPPAKATGLSSEVSHNMVILTWDDPNDDSITGYLILRRDKDIHEEGTFLTVAPDTGSSETTYVDAAIEPERRYVYRIKAINASGVSEMSSWVRAYTPAVPDPAPEAPAKPTSLSATFSHDSVTLAWDDPGDDSITGYVILRRDKDLQPEDGTLFTVTSDTGSAGTTYTDDTAEPDKRYVYRIKAINEHGEMSEISSWVRAYTPAAP